VLVEALEAAAREIVVGPGTLLVVDNYLGIHGRPSFKPRYDGTDRWLKKLTVSRNLRRSLGFHATASPRVIF
jgi:L-asparagine oxygenase